MGFEWFCYRWGEQFFGRTCGYIWIEVASIISALQSSFFLFFFFLRFYLFNFRKRERERVRVGEKQQCVFASRMLPMGDLAHNPGMCPNWESNQQPSGSQASTRSTEPHQPGHPFLEYVFKICFYTEFFSLSILIILFALILQIIS